MKIKVNGNNEYKFYPNLGVTQDEASLFCVVLRRLSSTIHSGMWASYNAKTDGVDIDMIRRARAHVVRLENEFFLEDETGQEWKVTIEDIFSGKYPELYGIIEQINAEIARLDEMGAGIETKNLSGPST